MPRPAKPARQDGHASNARGRRLRAPRGQPLATASARSNERRQ
jgi:hypothetical protein